MVWHRRRLPRLWVWIRVVDEGADNVVQDGVAHVWIARWRLFLFASVCDRTPDALQVEVVKQLTVIEVIVSVVVGIFSHMQGIALDKQLLPVEPRRNGNILAAVLVRVLNLLERKGDNILRGGPTHARSLCVHFRCTLLVDVLERCGGLLEV